MNADPLLKWPLQPSSTSSVQRAERGQLSTIHDELAEECPIALEFNGISHVVMLATPANLEDFGVGFSVTESIVQQATQIYDVDVESGIDGVTVKIGIANECFEQLKQRRRNMSGRTGCGLCGTESLKEVFRPLKPVIENGPLLPAHYIDIALRAIQSHQLIQQKTGATHAAAWFDLHGQLKLIREDVGRHNALDKLIGAGISGKHKDWQQGMLVVTSRASMEMVQKTVIAGFQYLIAISAPTRLAVDLAQANRLCLIGFARPGKWTIYSHSDKLDCTDLPTNH
jgi:FdhD protein